jgi:hypothetical protein
LPSSPLPHSRARVLLAASGVPIETGKVVMKRIQKADYELQSTKLDETRISKMRR